MSGETLGEYLLDTYDNLTSKYRKTINCDIKDMEKEQAEIREYEDILSTCFGIEREFDFGNIY